MGDFQGLCLFTGGYPGVDHSPETCGPFLGIPWDPQKSVTVTEFGEVTFFYVSSKPIVNGVLVE